MLTVSRAIPYRRLRLCKRCRQWFRPHSATRPPELSVTCRTATSRWKDHQADPVASAWDKLRQRVWWRFERQTEQLGLGEKLVREQYEQWKDAALQRVEEQRHHASGTRGILPEAWLPDILGQLEQRAKNRLAKLSKLRSPDA